MNITKLPGAMRELRSAVYGETLSTLRVLELIAKIDKTREFLRHGHSSLYDYLTAGLKYSEGAATRRIRAARMLGKDKRVKKLIEQRKVSLCTLSLILDQPELLDEITGKSKREAEELVALKKGKASQVQERIVPIVVAVPAKKQSTESITATADNSTTNNTIPAISTTAPTQSETILEERYRVTFSYNKETKDAVEKARNLLSHKYPNGASIEELFIAGLNALIKEEQKRKNRPLTKNTSKISTPRHCEELKPTAERRGNLPATASSNRNAKNPRHIPATIKREVYKRDGGMCSFRHRDGSLCGSTWQVEIDHITPLALGGQTEETNLRLLCRAHNQHQAREAGLSR